MVKRPQALTSQVLILSALQGWLAALDDFRIWLSRPAA
jgi:hypothetical protein